MASQAGSSAEVRALVERCLGALEEGGQPAVDQLLAGHPEHAAAVRKRLSLLLSAGLLDETAVPERLGDFRLIRPIGQGGMGIVHLAEQISLGRRVALKLVLPERLYFDGARERFRREVEAVASLDHPNIVRVYAVGEEDGVPFYAMEYVDGVTLAEAVRALRERGVRDPKGAHLAGIVGERVGRQVRGFDGEWTDVCVRIALDIAAALVHAHGRGILHRDVKPSNIMLTADGQARLLDFGLARADGSQDLTRTGAHVGSLPYMSPEQVRGENERVDSKTDVYGLGVTLYEALTLQPAFWSDTDEETRGRILASNPTPIASINASVPWDAETVCRTAMSPEPALRYASMSAFLADLENLLARKPITARRPGLVLRGRRWIQREPARAALLALTSVAVLAGVTIFLVQSRAAETESRAHDRLVDAITAIDALLEQGSDESLTDRPGADPVRRSLLERAVALYEDLLAREADAPQLVSRVVEAQIRIGQLRRELGHLDESRRALHRALDLVEEIRAEDPDDTRALIAMADAILELARIGGGADPSDLGRQRLEQLIAELEPRLDEDPAVTERASIAWQLLAVDALARGDVDGVERCVARALALHERVRRDVPHSPRDLSWLASLQQNLGYAIGFYRRSQSYREHFEQAITLQQQLIDEQGSSATRRFQLARIHGTWGHVATVRNEVEDARLHSRQALEIVTALAAEFPDRAEYAERQLQFAFQLGVALERGEDGEAAEVVYRRNIEASRDFLERFPGLQTVLRPRAVLLTQLAILLARRGDGEEVVELWEIADSAWSRLLESAPENVRFVSESAVFLDNRARFEQRQGELPRARALAQTALERHREALARFPGRPELLRRVGKTSLLLAALNVELADHDAALHVLEQAVDDGGLNAAQIRASTALVDRLGDDPRLRDLLGR